MYKNLRALIIIAKSIIAF